VFIDVLLGFYNTGNFAFLQIVSKFTSARPSFKYFLIHFSVKEGLSTIS
jgi:hypothetical protein